MRKLIITAAASAGILLSTTMASAYGATMTYAKGGQGTYTECVTSTGTGTGASLLAQIQLNGLPKQPKSIAGPAGWSGAAIQNGSTWSVIWNTDPMLGSPIAADSAQHCGFTFQLHGKPLSGSFATQLWYYTANGTDYPSNPLTTSANHA